jgi:hypothetical protein
LTGGVDSLNTQFPFVFGPDLSGIGATFNTWNWSPADSVFTGANEYIFSLYAFSSPVESGTWCNSDNDSYFSGYPQTQLTILPNDNPTTFHTEVYLLFKNISSMVHVYSSGFDDTFPFYSAPEGLECTLVAVGVKEGILYSSFVPFTIGHNQSLGFSLTPTTTSNFIDELEALN